MEAGRRRQRVYIHPLAPACHHQPLAALNLYCAPSGPVCIWARRKEMAFIQIKSRSWWPDQKCRRTGEWYRLKSSTSFYIVVILASIDLPQSGYPLSLLHASIVTHQMPTNL
jgi:hypothetical protein